MCCCIHQKRSATRKPQLSPDPLLVLLCLFALSYPIAHMQARRARLLSCSAPAHPPSHLYEGCQALRCEVETASGARLVVVLGGPTAVLGQQALVEHALRQTLVSLMSAAACVCWEWCSCGGDGCALLQLWQSQ